MISPGSGKTRCLVAFAENVHVGVGQLKIFELERQDLTGTQTVQ